MKNKLLDQIDGYIFASDLEEAKHFKKELIKFDSKTNILGKMVYTFKIMDFYYGHFHTVKITIVKDHIHSIYCSCYEFGMAHSCVHIPAVILNTDVFTSYNFNNQELSKFIIDTFSKEKSQVRITSFFK